MSSVTFDTNSDEIWLQLSSFINNDYGLAGLMGNIWAESGFKPNNVENYGETHYGWTDDTYTAAVNNGTESFVRIYEFPNNRFHPLGYGICQWTSVDRKQGLYDMKVQRGVSIANMHLQIDWLKHELSTSYANVLSVLQNATSVREASDAVVIHFEVPAGYDTPEVQELRASYGQEVYDHYHGSPPTPPVPPIEHRPLPVWMMTRPLIF